MAKYPYLSECHAYLLISLSLNLAQINGLSHILYNCFHMKVQSRDIDRDIRYLELGLGNGGEGDDSSRIWGRQKCSKMHTSVNEIKTTNWYTLSG